MCGGHFFHILTPLSMALTPTADQPLDPVVATQQIRCPTCTLAILPEFVWCPKCGAALKAHPCAYCGQMIGPVDMVCDSCGASSHSR